MSGQTPASSSTPSLRPADIDGFSSLAELARDLRWSWNHGADEVWSQLDPVLWELTRNAWVVLQTVSREKLRLLLAESGVSPEGGCSRTSGEARRRVTRVVSAHSSAIVPDLCCVFQHGIHAG